MDRKHDVELLLVGYELLRGDRRDSHAEFLGRRLLEAGVRVARVHVAGDDTVEIASVVHERAPMTRVLVVTGGLGPTHDDVTREGVAEGIGLPLEFDERQWEKIQEYFARSGRVASESNRRQAMFPKGAIPIDNTRGTAPGFTIESGGCLVAVLPGPPAELRTMADAALVPLVAAIFGRAAPVTRTFRTMGIGESQMSPLLDELAARYTGFTLASLPHTAGVDLILRSKPDAGSRAALSARAEAFESDLRAALGNKIYTTADETLEEVIGGVLAKKGETIAVAESLTGGLLGKLLTDVPGSSRYVLADVVAYANRSKVDLLGVDERSLASFGAVSEAVCREMADGVRRRAGATYGLATTGIAGPGGGTEDKPVGLAYFGLSWEGGSEIRHRVFAGARPDVRERVVWASLSLVYEFLSGGVS
jgi:nicotinamide-nucleotide amidase